MIDPSVDWWMLGPILVVLSIAWVAWMSSGNSL